MRAGAWPIFVSGKICLLHYVNEQDPTLLSSCTNIHVCFLLLTGSPMLDCSRLTDTVVRLYLGRCIGRIGA